MIMKEKFYGVGVGPGNPEYMTIKAKKVLEKVDIIYTPVSRKDKKSKALQITEEVVDCQGRIDKLLFPMTNDQDKKEKHWQLNARKILKNLKKGKSTAFITIGDPLFYSTYIYLLRYLKKGINKENKKKEYSLETVPGITSINATSARLDLPLAAGNEKLVILPEIPENKDLETLIKDFDNVVLLKVSKNIDKVIEFLEKKEQITVNSQTEAEIKFFFVSRCGYEEEYITTELEDLKNINIDYLSLIIFKKGLSEII